MPFKLVVPDIFKHCLWELFFCDVQLQVSIIPMIKNRNLVIFCNLHFKIFFFIQYPQKIIQTWLPNAKLPPLPPSPPPPHPPWDGEPCFVVVNVNCDVQNVLYFITFHSKFKHYSVEIMLCSLYCCCSHILENLGCCIFKNNSNNDCLLNYCCNQTGHLCTLWCIFLQCLQALLYYLQLTNSVPLLGVHSYKYKYNAWISRKKTITSLSIVLSLSCGHLLVSHIVTCTLTPEQLCIVNVMISTL